MQLRATSLRAIKTGGRQRAWTPAQLGASLDLWLDAEASSTIILNGSNVSSWGNRVTGTGRFAFQGTATIQPAYVQNALNGKPAVLLDGVDDHLLLTAGTYASGSAAIFTVVQPSPSDVTYTLFCASNQDFTRFSDNATYGLLYRNFRAAPTQIGMPSSGPFLVGYNVNAPNSLYQIYLNGSLALNVAGGFSLANTPDRIGGSAGTNRFSGYFCEVVETTSDLSTENRQKLEGYLAWKWGLTGNLPANHPFKNTPPTA